MMSALFLLSQFLNARFMMSALFLLSQVSERTFHDVRNFSRVQSHETSVDRP